MPGSTFHLCAEGHRWNDAGPACPVCGGQPLPSATLSADSLSDLGPADGQATLPQSPAEPAQPPGVAGYVIERELGRGGMGVVYLARHTQLNRLVALKMILAGAHAGPQELARFRIEAQAAAQLQHPNIVQIYEVGESDSHPYLALEYVPGGSLAAHLTGVPWPSRDAARLIEPLARAIHHAHDRGIVHRDLKPANVLIGERKDDNSSRSPLPSPGSPIFPKITDFGLAKQLNDAEQRTARAGPTRTGAVMGTPSYIAPEQASGRGGAVGPATDVYALGAILYELLTGRPPFRGETPLDTVMQVMTDEPVAVRRLHPKVPRDLETICLKCLQKDPRRRYASAVALADDLYRYLNNEPIQARPASLLRRLGKWARRRPAAASLAAAGVVAGVAIVATSVFVGITLNNAAEREKRQKEAAQQEYVRAEGERAKAETERRESDRLRGEAVRQAAEARRNLYALQLAQVFALGERDPRRALQLLEDPAHCPPDLRDFTWGYLHRLCRRERAPLVGHDSAVSAVAYSPDGQTLASAAWDKTVRLWSPAGGPARQVLTGHTGFVSALAFSPDGRTLATAADDKTVKLWTLQRLPAVPPGLAGAAWPWPVARERATLTGHQGGVRCVAFNADGKTLATGGYNWAVKLWDVASTRELATLTGHKGPVVAMAFAPGGLLATGSADHTIKLWDTLNRADPLLATLTGHTDVVSALAFSPNGKTLASGGNFRDQSLRLWDVARREERARLKMHTRAVLAVAFAPDGQTLATGSTDGTIRLWDPTAARERTVLPGHPAQVMGLAISPDSLVLASGGGDREVRLWDLGEHREETRQAPVAGRFGPLRLDHDGRGLVFTDTAPQYWDFTRGHPEPLSSQALLIRLLATGPGGAAAGLDDHGTLRVWHDGRPVRALPNFAAVRTLAVSRDARYVAVGTAKGEIEVYDANSGSRLTARAGHAGPVTALAFSTDGLRLASGGADRAARVWDVAGLLLKQTFPEHPFEVHALAFSPAAPTLAVGCVDGTLRLWQVDVGGEPVAMVGHSEAVTALAFSPDGQALASGSRDHAVKIWDAQTGQERTTLTGHTDPIADVAFAADGLMLATATDDGTVKLWHADRH